MKTTYLRHLAFFRLASHEKENHISRNFFTTQEHRVHQTLLFDPGRFITSLSELVSVDECLSAVKLFLFLWMTMFLQ